MIILTKDLKEIKDGMPVFDGKGNPLKVVGAKNTFTVKVVDRNNKESTKTANELWANNPRQN
ncbi:MAG: hypothetical protein ABIH55_01540 [Nanoarchaeota archaeon]|nr:hypothetical protein [Nanoarchaeota archaeon]MBU1135492.1 hypothetical protein [Nanoarchaeota archaeon]